MPFYATNYFDAGDNLFLSLINQNKSNSTGIEPLRYSTYSDQLLLQFVESNQKIQELKFNRQLNLSKRIFEIQNQLGTIELQKYFDSEFANQASLLYYEKFQKFINSSKRYSIEDVNSYYRNLRIEMNAWYQKIMLLKSSIKIQISEIKSKFVKLPFDWVRFENEVLDSASLYNISKNVNGISQRTFESFENLRFCNVNYAKIICDEHGEDFILPFFDIKEYSKKIRVAALKQQGYKLYVFSQKDVSGVYALHDSIKVWGNTSFNKNGHFPIYSLESNKLFSLLAIDSTVEIMNKCSDEIFLVLKYLLKQKLVRDKSASQIYHSLVGGNNIDGWKEHFTKVKNPKLYTYELQKFLTEIYKSIPDSVNKDELLKKLSSSMLVDVRQKYFSESEINNQLESRIVVSYF
jgi:hypothetical protein